MLTTEVKTFVLVFHDKTKKHITSSQAEAFIKDSSTDKKSILIDGNLINFSSVAKLLTIEEYNTEYPLDNPPVYNQEYVSQIQHPTNKARGLMLKGLKQYCDENPTHLKAKAYFDKLSGIVSGNDYWVEVWEKYKDKARSESEEKHFQHALTKINI